MLRLFPLNALSSGATVTQPPPVVDPPQQAPSDSPQTPVSNSTTIATVQVFHMNEPQLPNPDEFFGKGI